MIVLDCNNLLFASVKFFVDVAQIDDISAIIIPFKGSPYLFVQYEFIHAFDSYGITFS